MSTKRLLFIQDDPFLGSVYRDHLENAGFAVETARSSEAGMRLLDELRPDAVLLDPVLPYGNVEESIQNIRSRSFAGAMPIFVLPTPHGYLANSAQDAGATCTIDRSGNPLGSLISQVTKAFGLDTPQSSLDSAATELHWKRAALTAAPGTLTAVRNHFHEVMRAPENPQYGAISSKRLTR